MSLLAFQLAGVYAIHSIARGAVLAGISAFTAGFIGPVRGAWLDRREMRRGLQMSCCASASFMGLFAGAVALHAKFFWLAIFAIGLGLSVGGIWGGFRALMLNSVPERLLRRAHFVESLSTEVGYGLGPLLVTAIAVVGGVTLALSVMTVVFLGAALMLSRVAELPATPHQHRIKRTRNSKPVLLICAVGALLSFGYSMVEGNVPARVAEIGLNPNSSGIFLAMLSVGSVLGGIIVSLLPSGSHRPAMLAAALLFVFAALLVPGNLVSGRVAYGATLLFTSLMLVPLTGLCAAEMEQHVGHSGRGRVFALLLGATQVGAGAGVATAGALQPWLAPHDIPYLAVGLFVILGAGLAFVGLHMSSEPRKPGAPSVSESPLHNNRTDVVEQATDLEDGAI